MSILDGVPQNQKDFAEALQVAAVCLQELLKDFEDSDRERFLKIADLMQKGMTLGDILELSSDDLNTIFSVAIRTLQVGQIEKTQDIAMMLHLYSPLEAKFLYLLAMTYQMQGNHSTAAQFYILFLALDATNADGYARLGECLLATQEHEKAREAFEAAIDFSIQGYGSHGTRAHARALLDYTMHRKTKKTILN